MRWKVPSIDEGIFHTEREREREPQLPEVVEAHETREMLSNAKEKTFKCSNALEAGLTVVLQLPLMQIVGYSSVPWPFQHIFVK
jgi:hypothetical protein